jgi:hypothetical protein
VKFMKHFKEGGTNCKSLGTSAVHCSPGICYVMFTQPPVPETSVFFFPLGEGPSYRTSRLSG